MAFFFRGTWNYINFFKALSTLTLFMPRVAANHAHHPLAAHDLALAADLLH
jgi:hypothetical protein